MNSYTYLISLTTFLEFRNKKNKVGLIVMKFTVLLPKLTEKYYNKEN